MSDGRSVPLRPLGVVELLDGAVRLVRHNPGAAFAIGLPFAVARTAAVTVVALATIRSRDAGALQTLTVLAATGLLGTIRTGMLAPVFTADVVGERITAVTALRRALPSSGWLLVTALIVMTAQGAGVLLLAAGGVWLWGAWAVAGPALTVERLRPLAALGRSFGLVRGRFWPTWGQRALGWVVTSTLAFLVTVPFAALATVLTGDDQLLASGTLGSGADDPRLFVLITALGSVVAATVVGPVSSAIDTLLYVDLRMRHEGLDLIMTLPPVPPAAPAPAAAPGITAW